MARHSSRSVLHLLSFLLILHVQPIRCHFIPTQLLPNDLEQFADDAGSNFNWADIQPSRRLKYHDCYEGLLCARLLLPLDWTQKENKENVALAIARLPATLNVTDPAHGGTIIINPGGPSGSGIGFLRSNGRLLQRIVQGEKSFDVLSFDPRGVFHSTPHPDCFENSLARQAFNLRRHSLGTLDVSNETVKLLYASTKGYGQMCAEHSQERFDIKEYMSTASVASDILEIVNQVEADYDLQRQEDRDLADRSPQGDLDLRSTGNEQQTMLSQSRIEDRKLAKLQYWVRPFCPVLYHFVAK